MYRFAGLLIALLLSAMVVFPAHADNILYEYILIGSDVHYGGSGVQILDHYTIPTGDIVDEYVFGKFTRGEFCGSGACKGASASCTGSFCAAGRFIYERNPDFTVGNLRGDNGSSGLRFSAPVVQTRDTRDALAFTNSFIALQANLAGFFDQDFIKGLLIAVIGFRFTRIIFRLVLNLIHAWTDDPTSDDNAVSAKDGTNKTLSKKEGTNNTTARGNKGIGKQRITIIEDLD